MGLRVITGGMLLAGALLISAAPALAEGETTRFTVTRGLLIDQPYTVIYPDFMTEGATFGGTVMHLDFPGQPLQCELLIKKADAPQTAQEAFDNFDVPAAEAMWKETYPNFKAKTKGLTSFQSGPAFLYWGETGDNANGPPLNIYRASAVDGGRLYVFECFMATSQLNELLGVVDFLFTNFSTRSDAECCVDISKEPQ